MSTNTRFPALFVGHGSPMNAIENNAFSQTWAAVGLGISRPKAILAISAHWETDGIAVTAMAKPRTIHDFGGFPPALHAAQYPAPGAPLLAEQIARSLSPLAVQLDQKWGLDHGTWSVLIKMYPNADIPVVQLSLPLGESPQFHFELGQKLSYLREQGVLLLGSGNIVHNLHYLDPRLMAYDWAERFNSKICAAVQNNQPFTVINFHELGEDARLAVPSNEHFLPLLTILGARHPSDRVEVFNDDYAMGSISMTSFVFE